MDMSIITDNKRQENGAWGHMFFIMGITDGRKDFDFHQMMTCGACGAYGRYQVFMTYTVLSLFFIPCIKWNIHYCAGELLQCALWAGRGDWKTDCARRGCRDSATTFASGASGESWKRLEYYKTVQKLWFYDHGGLWILPEMRSAVLTAARDAE